jgi:hypothetical protein
MRQLVCYTQQQLNLEGGTVLGAHDDGHVPTEEVLQSLVCVVAFDVDPIVTVPKRNCPSSMPVTSLLCCHNEVQPPF